MGLLHIFSAARLKNLPADLRNNPSESMSFFDLATIHS
jgi:hypothetical protein